MMQQPLANYTLKDEIRDYWSDRSATFDQSVSHRICDSYGIPEWHLLLRQAFSLEEGETLKGHSALDIACGTGEVSRVLTGFGASVTAVDFSERMLSIAHAKLAGQDWTGLLADAEALTSLPDASFDVAVTRHLAWTLTEPPAAYREWRRVLKPGGRLLILDGDWTAPRSLSLRLRHWLADRLGPGPDVSSHDRDRHAGILSRLAYRDGLTAERLERDLLTAGFGTVRSLPIEGLYSRGMRGARVSERLRQTAEHRFALLAK